ncbi:MAG: chitobiase/beta-hexosaminidase C-terminal domain-containing protein [Deltaproteobacteria bacterium]|nr:chitobiase/beta-hexosaminidase C-terminal domain-containing protein [Deltaproteobacteria bacterium]
MKARYALTVLSCLCIFFFSSLVVGDELINLTDVPGSTEMLSPQSGASAYPGPGAGTGRATSYQAGDDARSVGVTYWSAMSSGTTKRLMDAWGSSGSNVFAVGEGGTILHYNGTAWSAMSSGTTSYLEGVWGSSSSDVFAVGSAGGNSGTILHYDGTAWSTMSDGTTKTLTGVWGSSSSDVFAAGPLGTIMHYDGAAWSAMPSGTTNYLVGVWGSSSSDVFAVGFGGTIMHYDGTAWSAMSSGTTEDFYRIWGSSGNDVFAVGHGGTILHYNGTAWSAMSSGTTKRLIGVRGSSGSDVFAVGTGGTILHYNGTAWSAMSSGTTSFIWGIWGNFAVGEGGTILHYNGTAWSAMSSGTTSALSGVWGSSGSDVFAVGDYGTILHYNGTAWSAMSSGATSEFTDVWGSSGSSVFAVDLVGTIMRYNGTAWSAMSSGTTGNLFGVWGSSGSDVFAVGYAVGGVGMIRHYNGTAWSAMSSGTATPLRGVWGSSSSDVFAVGDNGTILHYTGSSPSIISFNPTSGGSGTAVTITGTHFSGTTAVSFGGTAAQSPITVNSDSQITAVVGTGATGPIQITTPQGSCSSSTNFTYIFGTVATPTFSPAAGTYATAQSVTIACATVGATIRYTTDGTDPTAGSNQYTAAISVPLNTSKTIKAKAFKTGWTDSAVASGVYNVTGTVATPTFSPAAGTFTTAQSVTIACTTTGATIYYTTDGSTPTSSSTQYTAAISIPLNTNMTIKAKAVNTGWVDSAVASGVYNVTGTVATPTFSPAAGTFATAQSVTIACATVGSAIRYTIDGTDPTSSSTQYTAAISVPLNTNMTIKAKAFKTDWVDSAVGSGVYNVTGAVATPTLSPAAGTYTTAQSVTIACATPGATIRYTTDNSTPTSSSTQYTTAISVPLNTNMTIKAKAFKTGWVDSAVASGVYNVGGTVATPTLSPAPGTYTTAQNVTISYATDWSAMFSTASWLRGVWGSSSSDVFTVGDNGTILHYDGTAWSAMSSGTRTELNRVWGNSSSDVFAVGVGAILHYDGTAWSGMSSNALFGIWGSSGSNVFGVGYDRLFDGSAIGAIQHYDGTAWSDMSIGMTNALSGVWGSSGSDVFAVGGNDTSTTILHYDGTAWSAMSSGATNNLFGVWGSSGSNVFAVGNGGTILHYDGTAWSAMSSGTTSNLFSVWGSSGSDVFVGGDNGTILHYNGTAWSAMSSSTINETFGFWGSSGSNVFAVGGVGANGTILHYNGPSTNSATIRYTTDGSTPTSSSTQYTTAIGVPLNTSKTIKAKAFKTGWVDSPVASGVYNVTGTVATPTFSPASGTYTTAKSVTIACATAGATIRYTTNGTDPTSSSTLYSVAINVATTTTIKAKAFKSGWADSAIGSSVYTF